MAVAVAAGLFVVAPQIASAQILDPEGSGREYCASGGPNNDPRYELADPWTDLNLFVDPPGAGYVDATMYGMPSGSDCIRTRGTQSTAGPDRCPPSCQLEVQTVCELHCGVHRHSAPFPWTVRLTATATGPDAFVGWKGPCLPQRRAAWSHCIVKMDLDRSVTAVFGPPDTIPPAPAPRAHVTPLGGYNLEVAWTAANDPWLAGYDILLDGAVRSRLASSSASARVTVTCNTSYTVQVIAYDFTGNAAPGNVVNVRSGACNVGAAPRPNTVIHVKPPRTTKSRTAFFHFGYRGETKPTRYQCKLDKRRWAKCSGVNGKRYRKLTKGYHTFRVRAGNSAGWDPTPAKWRWRIR